MIVIRNSSISLKSTLCTRQRSAIAPALPYYLPSMAVYAVFGNISAAIFARFPCNHSLCTGSTVVGQCMEQLPNGYALITGFLRYKLLPVIYHPGWLSPFNFVPYKISHPTGSLRSCKIVPTILSANRTN